MFDEVRFPNDISRGSSGGPERRTEIVELRSGHEERNSIWADSRRRYDAGLGLRHLDDLSDTLAFFEARMGRLYGFRWKDWADFKSSKPSEATNADDQLIGVGDNSKTEYQLKKTYASGSRSYVRDINKPVAGSVKIQVAGLEVSEGADFNVDTVTGVITFTTAPTTGAEIRAGYEFDVPVRFDEDSIEINVEAFRVGAIPRISIVEVKQ